MKLFTTEDGTEIYSGNEYWVVNSTLPETLIKAYSDKAKLPKDFAYQESWQLEWMKTFSTKAKAEEFIKSGKVLRDQEIVNHMDDADHLIITAPDTLNRAGFDNIIKKLKEIKNNIKKLDKF